MKKNHDRKVAETKFLEDKGRITNKEMAKNLGVHPATVARWKKADEWDLKLMQTLSEPEPATQRFVDTFDTDVRHIRLLNERIDSYLSKKELLTSEILELSEAKLNLINCMEIISENARFCAGSEFDDPSNLDYE
ncbi:MAG: phage terminase small subunit-related protein [Desulfomonilaceae bacterium]